MIKTNPFLNNLQDNYLFRTIAQRAESFRTDNPEKKLLNLGIGDTREPLPQAILQPAIQYMAKLGTSVGFEGYGPAEGISELREAIAETLYSTSKVNANEIFVSDGAKSDLARLLFFFGEKMRIAVQSPTYPAFVDDTVIAGQSGLFDAENKKYKNILYLECTPENNFFPDLSTLKNVDLVYLCNPNNPTGIAYSYKQLENFVQAAKTNNFIILYDAAYRDFLQGSELPQSIYEIPGAKEVAIEIGSFSKGYSFTGLRLGWLIIPQEIITLEKNPLNYLWSRYINTCFNGPSRPIQHAGLAALSPLSQSWSLANTQAILQHLKTLKKAFTDLGYQVYGGNYAPYLWVHTPKYEGWDAFNHFLSTYQLITVPGVGFGNMHGSFTRISGFLDSRMVEEVVQRLTSTPVIEEV